jgi:hypothetical protein
MARRVPDDAEDDEVNDDDDRCSALRNNACHNCFLSKRKNLIGRSTLMMSLMKSMMSSQMS